METVNQQHVQPRLGQCTIAQYRRGKRFRKLPAELKLDFDHLLIAEGRVIFVRCVSARGRASLLGQTFQVGQRHKFTYVKSVLDTRRQRLTVYVAGKVFERWSYKLSRK